MSSEELRAAAAAWLAADPDEADRAELAALLADDSEAAGTELADRFSGRLEFGTAGLRGVVAAGPRRMNTAVVRMTTAALARWLLQHDPGAAEAGVVIGCDARQRSDQFAEQTAAVLAGAGIRARLLPPRQPTPLLAFAVRQLRAAAGVMITASHNPAADNGYKLYLADGAQIVPPADAEIEAAARDIGPAAQIPVAGPDSPLISRCGDELARAYLDAICAVSAASKEAAWLRFVYTPLHGVAGELALRAFEQAGFPEPDLVTAQAEPDPRFPTVAFPNPEEPGALDLALAQARRSGADLVIANDPDGDRLAVAVPDPEAPGGWRALTGDQVGALLGSYLLGQATVSPDRDSGTRDGRDGDGSDRDGGAGAGPAAGGGELLVVSTIVSATMLARIAAAAGARHAETLTGFKWIMRAAESWPAARFVFGYEEALGYAVSGIVRDKDGIGAALAVLGLAARARSRGGSLLDAYNQLETAHGVHLTAQLTVPTTAPAKVMARLRAQAPAELGGSAVLSVTDLAGRTSELPPADVLSYRLADARVVIRPSGTEPKVKAYLQVVEPVTGRQLASARQAAQLRMAPLREAVRDLLS